MKVNERLRVSLIFLACIGVSWALLEVWALLSLGWISGEVASPSFALLYWIGMLFGPLALIVGPALLFLKRHATLGRTLAGIGCFALTAIVLYNGLVAMRSGPLDPPPSYSLFLVLFAAMLATDFVGLAVIRYRSSFRSSQAPQGSPAVA